LIATSRWSRVCARGRPLSHAGTERRDDGVGPIRVPEAIDTARLYLDRPAAAGRIVLPIPKETRMRILALTLALSVTVPVLAADPPSIAAPDPKVPQGKNLDVPEGWSVRADDPLASAKVGKDDKADITFVNMTPGWHLTTGPAAIFHHPGLTARGEYRLTAKIHFFDPKGRLEGYGVFFGGSDLAGDKQSYGYFLLRNDRKSRSRSEAATRPSWSATGRRATPSSPSSGAGTARCRQHHRRRSARASELAFAVNGAGGGGARSALPADGQAGLRVNHQVNIHVSEPHGAARRRRATKARCAGWLGRLPAWLSPVSPSRRDRLAPGAWVARGAPCPRNWGWAPPGSAARESAARGALPARRRHVKVCWAVQYAARPNHARRRSGALRQALAHRRQRADHHPQRPAVRLGPLRCRRKPRAYSAPGPERWEMVVNGSTRQWGLESEYRPEVAAREEGRLNAGRGADRALESLDLRPETIASGGHELVLEWQTHRVRLPLAVGD
jgi:hypothetical protein